jgi:hypothetical protein
MQVNLPRADVKLPSKFFARCLEFHARIFETGDEIGTMNIVRVNTRITRRHELTYANAVIDDHQPVASCKIVYNQFFPNTNEDVITVIFTVKCESALDVEADT